MTTRLLITLDYELFFGQRVGSVEHCMIQPINKLIQILDQHGARLTLFVDAGYLDRLQLFSGECPELQRDYQQVTEQLRSLVEAGHEVQLHIHPHWEDTEYRDGNWQIDTSRYRLHDFDREQAHELVGRYKQRLVEIVGDRIFAYRAGGWCIQPFAPLADALHQHGIWLDSTVYDAGYSPDEIRGFDFRQAPQKEQWRFDEDPVVEDPQGRFVEIPITACRVLPSFYWKMVYIKKFAKGGEFKSFGDGQSMVYNAAHYWKLLSRSSNTVTSIDGAKAGLLERAYRCLKASGAADIFNVMGHPKALTPYSLKKLDAFLAAHPELEGSTFQDFIHLKP
ncbi:polysaccharide deacetylase family protein [Candidatus Endoriftia persephonae]|jgi:hypothetical protein|uniref:Polysaccharide deacetylase n=2 Tax=Gammaproteobacteria TaxID=1236 RepID=G2FBI8_9GAMM|nr:polysaccharide deacetylase family protein [Candidatus Endoriftia persephone]EGW55669.1 hypothetical protein TevJSym_ab00210 [endosymbiont of Tevnia jerichonana (vent Tica)]USF86339.1 polysaccharide deacetylase family protein [Candidatus Endoriftia persephone]